MKRRDHLSWILLALVLTLGFSVDTIGQVQTISVSVDVVKFDFSKVTGVPVQIGPYPGTTDNNGFTKMNVQLGTYPVKITGSCKISNVSASANIVNTGTAFEPILTFKARAEILEVTPIQGASNVRVTRVGSALNLPVGEQSKDGEVVVINVSHWDVRV